MKSNFGEFMRELRIAKEITLREFARKTEIDVGNLSKIERGVTAPPQKEDTLELIANLLELDQVQKDKLFELSRHEIGKYPKDVENDLKNYEYIPLLLRTIANKKLTDEQIKELTKQINSYK